jgi:hypothetical protein
MVPEKGRRHKAEVVIQPTAPRSPKRSERKRSEPERRYRRKQKELRDDGRTGKPVRWAGPNQKQNWWAGPDVRGEDRAKPKGPDQLSVPPEMEAQAQVAMARYDMRVSGMKIMATKPEKGGAIWRIDTDRGPRSLKLLHRPLARSLFSIGAQDYLVKQGARVPALIPARDGLLYTLVEGKVWIVTDWIDALVQAPKVDLTGAASLCYGLGEFHRLSRGYLPPEGAQLATRLHHWPQTYRKVLTKMGWFRELARAYSEYPASQTLLSLVDTYEQQALDAIARLERSPYAQLTARGEREWGIVHQDERCTRTTAAGQSN